MHEILDEFEFRQGSTTDYGVNCTLTSEKSRYNVVNTLAPSFLIESSSFLQVTRTIIKSDLSSKLRPIGSCTVEKAALECLKTLYRLRLYDSPDLKLFILVGLDRSFRLLLGLQGLN